MKKIKILICILVFIIILLVGLFIFLNKNNYNFFHFGNNMSNKTSNEIAQYILNISSYEAKVKVEIKNNKTTNKYVLKQEYVNPDLSTQTVLEPSNIKDLKMSFDGENLKLENSKLNLKTIYENYTYISENNLFLNSFIEDYKTSEQSKLEENDDEIIMHTKASGSNQYAIYKILYVDKKTGNPKKLEVQDINQNLLVYILYNEIKLNSINEDDILAFRVNNILFREL